MAGGIAGSRGASSSCRFGGVTFAVVVMVVVVDIFLAIIRLDAKRPESTGRTRYCSVAPTVAGKQSKKIDESKEEENIVDWSEE